MKTYIIKFNKTLIPTDTYEEALSIALGLIDRTCPHVATIFEIDEDNNQRTIAKFDASHA